MLLNNKRIFINVSCEIAFLILAHWETPASGGMS